MEASDNDYGDLSSVLEGNSAIFIADTAKWASKNHQRFRKKVKNQF